MKRNIRKNLLEEVTFSLGLKQLARFANMYGCEWDLPNSSEVKNLPAALEPQENTGSILGLGRSPGTPVFLENTGNPENSMDRGA